MPDLHYEIIWSYVVDHALFGTCKKKSLTLNTIIMNSLEKRNDDLNHFLDTIEVDVWSKAFHYNEMEKPFPNKIILVPVTCDGCHKNACHSHA